MNLFKKLLLLILLPLSAWSQSPKDALKAYLNRKDAHFAWEIKDSSQLGSSKLYQVVLTSQGWKNIIWRHQLTIIVPKEIQYQDALLFITGGSNANEQPNWSKDDRMWPALAMIGSKNKAVVALLKQVPNQPLMGDKTEDALISHTLHQYRNDKQTDWPLLFPMVKSALKAMDAIQAFGKQKLNKEIQGFTVTGASKRGWTTWLTAASQDPRVRSIAPMVIDMLNMPATLNYQYQTYGEYSIEIEDYVKLGIPQGTGTPDGQAITQMIDPYSYRANLTVPKMIFIGTNDPYWTADAIKHYIGEIPGQNLIHYVPNVGHDLGGGKQALESLSSFFGLSLQKAALPTSTWKVNTQGENVVIQGQLSDTKWVEASIWHTTSSDRDFRNNLWLNQRIKVQAGSKEIQQSIPLVKKGYQAFYVELKYKDAQGGTYSVCSRVYTTDQKQVL